MPDPIDYGIPDENEIEDVIADLPALVAVRAFASRLGGIAWFKNVGDSVEDPEAKCARAYLDALGFPDVELAPVQDWETAAAAAESLDWNSDAWQTEEQLRASLSVQALDHMNEDALAVAMSHVAAKAGDTLEELSAEIAALWEVDDYSLINAAAGAAVQVSHQAALVIAAEAENDHPFAIKLKLFEMGRWPISIAGSSFNLF